jgi:hypothetical protein
MNILTETQQALLKEINNLGAKEGWSIFCAVGSSSPYGDSYQLQRIDEDNKFESDIQAIIYVADEALKHRDSLYANALRFLKENSPYEVSIVIGDIVGKEKLNQFFNN